VEGIYRSPPFGKSLSPTLVPCLSTRAFTPRELSADPSPLGVVASISAFYSREIPPHGTPPWTPLRGARCDRSDDAVPRAFSSDFRLPERSRADLAIERIESRYKMSDFANVE